MSELRRLDFINDNYNLKVLNNSNLDQIARLISKSTCQLFNLKAGTKEFPVPNGCSILFEYNGSFYCLSNAHVLGDKNFGRTFVLVGGGKTTNIGGQSFSTQLPDSGNRNDDKLDIAIVKLENKALDALKERNYLFINIDNIRTGYSPQKSDLLLFVGYPASQTKIKIDSENKNVKSKPFFFVSRPITTQTSRNGFSNKLHIVAKYSRNKIKHPVLGIKRGPSPRGMSGSGVWLLHKTGSQYTPFLVGILTEYHENRSILICTKIDLFIDIIRQKMDNTIPNQGLKVQILN